MIDLCAISIITGNWKCQTRKYLYTTLTCAIMFY